MPVSVAFIGLNPRASFAERKCVLINPMECRSGKWGIPAAALFDARRRYDEGRPVSDGAVAFLHRAVAE